MMRDSANAATNCFMIACVGQFTGKMNDTLYGVLAKQMAVKTQQTIARFIVKYAQHRTAIYHKQSCRYRLRNDAGATPRQPAKLRHA